MVKTRIEEKRMFELLALLSLYVAFFGTFTIFIVRIFTPWAIACELFFTTFFGYFIAKYTHDAIHDRHEKKRRG